MVNFQLFIQIILEKYMNIFFIDKCPVISAMQLCDKHVVKMVLETAQMCSTAIHEFGFGDEPLLNNIYKSAYKNHPMTVWVRENEANMLWAVLHGLSIGREYKYRYGKDHKSTAILENISQYMFHDNFDVDYTLHTEPPQCMPEMYKRLDYVEAYRAYYIDAKSTILTWTKRKRPEWVFPYATRMGLN